MPDLCRGSGSSLNTQYGTVFTASAVAVEAALLKVLPKETRVAFSSLLAGATYQLTQICSGPAPAFPVLSPGDWFNVLAPASLGGYSGSILLFQQWFQAYMWPIWCVCGDGLPPGAQAPTAVPPAGQDSGMPSGQGNSPCWDTQSSVSASGGDPVSGGQHDVTQQFLPTTQTVTVTSSVGGGPGVAQLLPSGINGLSQSFDGGAQTGGTTSPVQLEFYTASGTSLGLHGGFNLGQSNPNLQPITIPSGAASWAAFYHNPNANAGLFTWRLQFFCSAGGPTVIDVPCCPPDPTLEIKLNQILQLILNLTTGSSTPPPSGWHDGNAHTNLRGAGSFFIDPTAIGIRWDVTMPPAGTQVDPGNPDFYWDMGFWTPYAIGSPLRGGRLVYLHQSVELPEFTDQLGYTLKHGTVLNATELLPTIP